MLRNLKFSDLLKSKTFWGGVIALVSTAATTLAPQSAGVAHAVQLLGSLLALVGLVDRTTPAA